MPSRLKHDRKVSIEESRFPEFNVGKLRVALQDFYPNSSLSPIPCNRDSEPSVTLLIAFVEIGTSGLSQSNHYQLLCF